MSRFISPPNNSDISTGVKSIIKKESLLSKITVHGAATKVCNNCHVEQSLAFFQWRDNRTKIQNQCDDCRRKKDHAYKTSNIFRYITYLAKRILSKYGRKRRKPCALSPKDFVALFIEQQNKFGMQCPYSGLTMTYDLGEGKTPTNISIDRFDSNKPYEKGNIIFCCNVINVMKFDSSYTTFITLCEQIAAHKDDIPAIKEYLCKQK